MTLKRLLEPEGLEALERVLALRPLIAFDFDGTLSPIVEHPDDARVLPALEPRLARLSGLADVAIISGRALPDLKTRLTFEPRHAVGNHGAEGGPLEPLAAADLAGETDRLLGGLRARLDTHRARFAEHGVEVEDKGRSMAIHYRRSPDRARAREAIEAALADHDPGLEVYGGHAVVNIVVAAAPDKGRALLEMVRHGGYASAIFVGDDVNDESVFSRALPGWLTVRIGLDAPGSQAGWRLASIEEMPAFVDRMIDGLAALTKSSTDRWAGR